MGSTLARGRMYGHILREGRKNSRPAYCMILGKALALADGRSALYPGADRVL